MIQIRKGQAPAQLERAEFGRRFRADLTDPDYDLSSEWIAAKRRTKTVVDLRAGRLLAGPVLSRPRPK